MKIIFVMTGSAKVKGATLQLLPHKWLPVLHSNGNTCTKCWWFLPEEVGHNHVQHIFAELAHILQCKVLACIRD